MDSMDTLHQIYALIDTLELEYLEEVKWYVEEQTRTALMPKPGKPRVLGLHAGAITISDDFNDPLPDEFWFGEG
ncbi:MAG: hypothetical protein BroJett018_26500 [Chloroflexota bacterium]|nr:MAG: hypothetical protein BroJett018_26500 [Chloroflexota bacterium]